MQAKIVGFGVLAVGAVALGGVILLNMGESDTPSATDASFTMNTEQASKYERPSSFNSFDSDEAERRAPEQTQAQGDRKFDMRDMAARMAMFDIDGDGILSDEERDAMRKAMREEMIARFDLDGDGEVSREERRAARTERFENSDRGQELMREFDLDGDGVLSDDEQAAMDQHMQEQRDQRRAEQLAEYDLDGDGELSREERQVQRDEQRAQWAGMVEQATNEFDYDGDGQLNIEESQAAMLAYMERREIDQFLSRYDSNGDGSMGAADYDAFVSDYQSGNSSADVNRDGVIDIADLNAYRDLVTRSANRP